MIPQRVEASKTLSLLQKVKELKAQGHDIAAFTAGEPDFNTPMLVIEKAYQAMKEGDTKYVASQGHLALRQAVAADYRQRLGCAWAREDHVLVTIGSKQGAYLTLAALLDPCDEVLIPAPYWVSYPDLVASARGKPVVISTQARYGFFPTIEELEKGFSSKTKALIFSSPSNPTGCMIEADHLKAICDWCVQKKVVLIYDELYERIVFDGGQHVSASKLFAEKDSDYLVVMNAFSKTIAMTGWRLGWLLSSRNNIKNLTAFQSQMVTCAPGFIQQAGTEGLKRVNEFWPQIMESFQHRRDLIVKELSSVKDIDVILPQGAFYVFLNCQKWLHKLGVGDDLKLAETLLTDWKVSVVPGSSFGMNGWIRLSFATNEQEIIKGCQRLRDFSLS